MNGTYHLLTGEYPPQTGGVGDYTRLVALGLVRRGCVVHVWCPAATDTVEGALHVHRLPDAFGAASRRALEDAITSMPGCVVVEYVPNALGARGANVPFCMWLLRMRRRSIDVRVMFHEPYMYFSWTRPSRNALALAQRLMAALLIRASRVAYVSTSAWVACLRPWGLSTMVESPVPATIALQAAVESVAAFRTRFAGSDADALVIGHFGTFGEHMGRELLTSMPAVMRAAPGARIVFIGRGGEAFAAEFARREPALASRLCATGTLSTLEVASALRACDLVVQPYPDGVTTRRTSVMAALANEVAVITTDGALTESTWRDAGAVGLAPASDPARLAALTVTLLQDTAARSALAAGGRRLYEARFALEHTLDALLSVPGAA
jgi:glycosyltransferase involved in cell wall biosynthesis